jgi:hypothetical protein
MPAPRRWHEGDLVLSDFSGGENYTDSEIKLLPNELSELRNYVPDKRGALKKRLGITKHNATALGSGTKRIFGLARFYREDATDIVVAVANESSGAKIYNVASSGASTDLGLDHDAAANYTLSTPKPVPIVQYRDRLYGCAFDTTTHGNSKNFVVAEHPAASTALLAWEMGVTTPTNALTGAEDGAGNVTGKVDYKYSCFYGEDAAHGQSNLVSTALTVTTTDKKILLTIFGASKDYADWDEAHDGGVDKVRIFRTEDYGAGDPGPYYFLADVTTGKTYQDNTLDADLDDTELPQTDNYAPDKGRYLCVHDDRIVMGHLYDGTDYFPKRVRWSLAGSPDIWPLNNHADAPAEHGDITGLSVIAGQLYVFYESAIARLTLYGGADNEFEIVTAVAGCWAPTSLTVGEELDREVAFFMAGDGRIYSFDGTKAHYISRAIKARLEEYEPFLGHIAGGWDGESYRLGYKARKNGSAMAKGWELRYNTKVRKLDPYTQENLGTWWPMWLAVEQIPYVYCRFDGGSDEGALYWGSYSSGFIFQSDSGNDDDGTNISYYFYTAYLDCGDAGIEKYFNSLAIDCASVSSLTVTWDTDWGDATNSFTTKEQSDPIRTYHDPAGRTNFRYIRVKVEGSDGAAPSTVYALVLRVGADRPSRKVT